MRTGSFASSSSCYGSCASSSWRNGRKMGEVGRGELEKTEEFRRYLIVKSISIKLQKYHCAQ